MRIVFFFFNYFSVFLRCPNNETHLHTFKLKSFEYRYPQLDLILYFKIVENYFDSAFD